MGSGPDVIRASNFVQLIHRGKSGRPISDSASVTAVFILEDGTEKEFTRIIKIQGHSSSAILLYLIDNKEVNEKKYLDELQSSGLCVNFESFFVFQGFVENFVRMKAKQFTSVIEDLSGSGTLRIRYDDLQSKMRKLKDKLNQLALQRKFHMTKKLKKKAEMLVYKEYHNLIQELEKTTVDEKLLLLYDNERKVTHCEEKYRKIEDSLKIWKQQKVTKLEVLQCNDLSNLRLQISKTTSDLHKMVSSFVNVHEESTVIQNLNQFL
jgi:structural maintenance of chromosome 1